MHFILFEKRLDGRQRLLCRLPAKGHEAVPLARAHQAQYSPYRDRNMHVGRGRIVARVHQQELEGCSTDTQGSFARFSVKVKDEGYGLQHIYFLAIRPDGRLVLGPLLRDPWLAIGGLEPKEEWEPGTAFEVANVGLTETRIFCSPKPIPSLLLPPTTAARDVVSRPEESELSGLRRKTTWYWVQPPDDEKECLKALRRA